MSSTATVFPPGRVTASRSTRRAQGEAAQPESACHDLAFLEYILRQKVERWA